jgi:hypothetical protein
MHRENAPQLSSAVRHGYVADEAHWKNPMQRTSARRGGDRARAKPRVQFLGRPHAT